MAQPREKPVAAALGWTVIATERPYATPWFSVRRDRIAINAAEEISYSYIEDTPAVFVVPVTPDGRIILIRQYRYPIDTWCLELPAGGIHDRAGMDLADVARAELREELGATCRSIEPVSSFYSSTSRSDQQCHVFLARDVALTEAQTLEATERIERHPLPAGEALELARRGEMKDGQSALALLLCEGPLRRYGYLDLDPGQEYDLHHGDTESRR